jgi:hypothetical protein
VLPNGPLVCRFKKALRAAGVRKIRFHDLRHTFGTRIAAAGVPMRVLQEWMGHRDYRTTLIYADYEPGDEESSLVDAAFSAGSLTKKELSRSRVKQRMSRLRKSFTPRRSSQDQRYPIQRVQPREQDPDPR